MANAPHLGSKVPTYTEDLQRFRKVASRIIMLPLRTRDPTLAHVTSSLRRTFMILNANNAELDVNLKDTADGYAYTVYA
ncbi:unnamed protein product [Lampetra planeri]